jgi:hypothetical protein
MPAGPFLSHKREDAHEVDRLWEELALRGASAWQDVRDLRLGQAWGKAFRRAILWRTDGFIWWATKRSLASETITGREVPWALRRALWVWRRSYPIVPLFVDIDPNRDRELLEGAFGHRRAEALLRSHGAIKEPKESLNYFAKRAARRYVKDLIRSRDTEPVLRVAITGERQPTSDHDLSLDWRAHLKEGYLAEGQASLELLRETLIDIREAAQETATLPRIEVETHLKLPLAAMVGWEWNRARQISLTIHQISPALRFITHEQAKTHVTLPEPTVSELSGTGPAVIALSTIKRLDGAARRYAEQVNACRLICLHLPGNAEGVVGADEIAAASDWTAQKLGALNDECLEKHLLILVPSSLATWIGAKAHGTGKTWIPFWDGDTGYCSGVEIG